MHMHIHPVDMCIEYCEYMAYMPSLMGIFVSGSYLSITAEVEVAVLTIYLVCWPCELYLECDSHICSVICVKYVYNALC